MNIIQYTKIYHFYRTAIMRTARLLVFAFLLFFILYLFSKGESPKIPQFFFNIFVMLEIFFHYKVSRAVPSVQVVDNKSKDIYKSFTTTKLPISQTDYAKS